MSKRALLTGIAGQDGAFLARHLLEQGYEVYGAARRASSANTHRLSELGIIDDVHLVDMDVLELSNVFKAVERVQPSEIYNLAAQSFVGVSFEQPIYTAAVNALGTTRLLEAIRLVDPRIRYYQASSSEMFGKAADTRQSETTPFYPRSPYGVAKLYGHWMTVNYREAYSLFATSGILFNHESQLRGQEFVTRKITLGLARIRHGQQDCLRLGRLDVDRDWGYAGDYVRGMHAIMSADTADDYVLATGVSTTVRCFVEMAGSCLGMRIEWHGTGHDAVGVDSTTGRIVVRVDQELYRPADVESLCGNFAKARSTLGWEPQVGIEALVHLMAEADERRVKDNRVMF